MFPSRDQRKRAVSKRINQPGSINISHSSSMKHSSSSAGTSLPLLLTCRLVQIGKSILSLPYLPNTVSKHMDSLRCYQCTFSSKKTKFMLELRQ